MDIYKAGRKNILISRIKSCITSIPHILIFLFLLAALISFISNKTILWTFSDHTQLWHIYIISIVVVPILLFILLKFFNGNSQSQNHLLNIFITVLICLIPRIICINVISIKPVSDFETYHIFASELSKGNIPGKMYISIFPHTIGYPAVLSIFYRIFGAKVIVAQIMNIILSCGIAVLIYILGSKLHSRRCGVISAIIWSLWPSQIFYVSFVSTETLFVFLNLLCIVFFIQILESRLNNIISLILFILLGALCAFANSIRPVALITLVAICIFLVLYNVKRTSYFPYDEVINIYRPFETYNDKGFNKILILAVILMSYLITSKAIQAVISNKIERPLPSKPFGYSLYIGTNYDSNGVWNQDDANTLGTLMSDLNMTPQMIHDTLTKLAVNRLKEKDTSQTVNLVWNKFNTMWSADSDFVNYMKNAIDEKSPSTYDFFSKYDRLLIRTSNFYYHVFLLIAGVGNLILLFRRKTYYSMICIIIIGYIVAHFFLEVAGRYHYPVISLISLLSGYGLVSLSQLLNFGEKSEVYI